MHNKINVFFSICIFQWDKSDYDLLREAKKGELLKQGMHPSEKQVTAAIKPAELGQHCRRRTRPVEDIRQLIDQLLVTCGTRLTHQVCASSTLKPWDTSGLCSRSTCPVFRILMELTFTQRQGLWKRGGIHLKVLMEPPYWNPSTVTNVPLFLVSWCICSQNQN